MPRPPLDFVEALPGADQSQQQMLRTLLEMQHETICAKHETICDKLDYMNKALSSSCQVVAHIKAVVDKANGSCMISVGSSCVPENIQLEGEAADNEHASAFDDLGGRFSMQGEFAEVLEKEGVLLAQTAETLVSDAMGARLSCDVARAFEKERQLEAQLALDSQTFSEKILRTKCFEIGMMIVILLHTVVVCVRLQLEGQEAGFKIGMRSEHTSWPQREALFYVIESLCNTAYLVELALRIAVLHGWQYFKHIGHIVDMVVVLVSCCDSVIFQVGGVKVGMGVGLLRVARLSRAFEILHFMRLSEELTELRVMLRTLVVAARGVLWALLILLILITMGAAMVAQATMQYLEDETITLETRRWMYDNFGTTTSAMWTMFVCTFTTGWRLFSRPLIEEVSYVFVVFWILWVVMVNFTTMRVVSAIFLKQTMSIASQDSEKQSMRGLKHRKRLANELRCVFEAADTSHDGYVSQSEFDQMMQNPSILADFHRLGLKTDQVEALFSVLGSDDDCVDYNELLNGALAMSTSTPTLDSIRSSQNQVKLANLEFAVVKMLDEMRQELHPVIQAFARGRQ